MELTVSPFLGVYLSGAILLVVAGVMKAARPGDTARALADLLPGPLGHHVRLRVAVRTGAVIEFGIGLCALAFPRPWTALAVAVSYLGFTAVVTAARSAGGVLASCGCFGRADTPATVLHLVINAVLAAGSGLVALGFLVWHDPARGSVLTVLGGQPWSGAPLLGLSALGAAVAYVAMAVMPAVQAARNPGMPTWRPGR